MPKMPFGKHKDDDIGDIPTSYLRWLRDEADLEDGWLSRAVRHELDLRDADEPRGYRHGPTSRPDPPPDPADLRDLVGRWHRRLVKVYHPDRGGDESAMKAVCVGRDALLEMLDEAGLLR